MKKHEKKVGSGAASVGTVATAKSSEEVKEKQDSKTVNPTTKDKTLNKYSRCVKDKLK